jgi:hypothetical protein
VTGFILVVRNGTTELPVIKHAVSILEQVTLISSVLF